jgi:outer membrane protein insertion porin family
MQFRHRLLPVIVLVCLVVGAAASFAQTVVAVDVEGTSRVSRDRVLLTFGMRAGEDLRPESIREGIKRLHETGHFSDVDVYAEEVEGGYRIIVSVVERPRIAGIEIEGADELSEDEILETMTITENEPYDRGRVEDSRVAIEALLREKGFVSGSVTIEAEQTAENAVRLAVVVEEGTRVIVRRIEFVGNESLDGADLEKVMETREDRWWRTDAYLDRDVLEEDLERIAERYRAEGYINARATGYDLTFEEEGERVVITIPIEEGKLYEVAGVEWTGASDFAVEALYDLTRVQAGERYRPEDAEATISDAYSWYGERGYIRARIRSEEDIEEEDRVTVLFHVDEGEPARIGQIHIQGNERTKEKVIRRELSIRPGDLYQTSEIVASQRKVANLGFFNGPAVEFMEGETEDDIDLVFTVEERQTGRAGVGVAHTSERGITGFIELNEGNLFGNGQYLDLKWEFGKRNTEVVLGFTEPWFLGRRLSVGFDVYDTDDKYIYGSLGDDFYEDVFEDHEDVDAITGCSDTCSRYYTVERERRGGDVRLGWPFFGSRHTMIYTKYTLEQYKLSEYVDIEYGDSDEPDTTYYREDPDWEWRSGVTATLSRRTTDRRFQPRTGSYSRLSADIFGGALGGDVEFQRYVLEVRKYLPSLWRTTLMLRGRAGLVTGYGDPSTVPEDTRFELGGVGVNGIRGYDNRSILPTGSELYGGRTMLVGTAELRIPITDEREQLPVYGVLFIDAGNTWESLLDEDDELATHPTDLYWGLGGGVRVEVPVLGVLGIDMGYGLDEDEGGEWLVHYQFGLDF